MATLQLGHRLPDGQVESLRFDPANTGGGLELAGYLNQLRRPAYRASQDGRGAGPQTEKGKEMSPGGGGKPTGVAGSY